MNKPLNRRTFLKASGVSLALPLLESMNPVFAAASNLFVTMLNNMGLETRSFGQSNGTQGW